MGDGVVYPSVFVVDGQQHGVPFVPPIRKKRRACWNGQFFLTSLIILALLGVATEGYFLIRFQKELEKTMSQVEEEAGAISEKSIQERKLNAEKPAAHVIGAAFTASRNGTLQWEHHKDLAFLRDMNYQDGSLVCIKPGYYYIYSKIQFMVQSCSQQSQKPFLTHGIYKKTPRYPQDTDLVVNVMPYCDSQDSDIWLDNSFLSGIFHLVENEEVYVQVSHRQVVQIRDGTRSYFGGFMI